MRPAGLALIAQGGWRANNAQKSALNKCFGVQLWPAAPQV
jgi:hypothetical protein